ncbi:MAG: type II toxin-antitoxin system antitoxin MazE7 [Solirubrobacterales bacterium]
MATETATIRVPRETRDRLAWQASALGISLSALLSRIAQEQAREAAFRSEREATRADARSAAVAAEEQGWDRAAGDGIK